MIDEFFLQPRKPSDARRRFDTLWHIFGEINPKCDKSAESAMEIIPSEITAVEGLRELLRRWKLRVSEARRKGEAEEVRDEIRGS